MFLYRSSLRFYSGRCEGLAELLYFLTLLILPFMFLPLRGLRVILYFSSSVFITIISLKELIQAISDHKYTLIENMFKSIILFFIVLNDKDIL